MTLRATRIEMVRRSRWVRIRYQLGTGLGLAVLIPYLIRLYVEEGAPGLESLNNSLIGTGVALFAGYYGFRQLVVYPGVKASRYIIPAFSISYGLVLTAFFLLRIDYSRLQFLSSFTLCLICFYFIYFQLRRDSALRVGIIPHGRWQSLLDVKGPEWVVIRDHDASPSDLDAIVADLRADLPDEWERFLADRAVAGKLVMHVKQMEETLTGRVAIEHLSENSLGSLLPGILYSRVKRGGDLLICLAALPLVLLAGLVAAIAIRIEGQGPILFIQERMGFRGRVFRMYKFRTMDLAAPSDSDDPRLSAITREGDSRITRLGQLLRRYRIDELPQVVNILRGEMSWIGPRPEALALSTWYEAELPFYRYRHIVRPGITGWAQVKQGHVAEVDEVLGKLHYDFYYIKNFGFWLDLLILAATIRIILGGFGSR